MIIQCYLGFIEFHTMILACYTDSWNMYCYWTPPKLVSLAKSWSCLLQMNIPTPILRTKRIELMFVSISLMSRTQIRQMYTVNSRRNNYKHVLIDCHVPLGLVHEGEHYDAQAELWRTTDRPGAVTSFRRHRGQHLAAR